MKKILWSSLLFGIMTLGVLECEKSKRKFEVENTSNINISQNNATMPIKEKNLTNNSNKNKKS